MFTDRGYIATDRVMITDYNTRESEIRGSEIRASDNLLIS